MTGLQPRRLIAGLLIVAAMTCTPLAAWAHTPCDPTFMSPVTNCELQTQAPVHYGSWETQGWAYYCTGDHPYYWGPNANYYENFTWDSSCFSVAENWWAEGSPNKFDATITNWCINPGGQKITVTLGCSKDPPPAISQPAQPSADRWQTPAAHRQTPIPSATTAERRPFVS